ncbi:hypothetical protein Cgig2_029691 [Carnegiea gigantea]|uniref:Pentatricopeptide repeat-containing protein n=1 Tax=Carnegiea gigantea TaxID=171969 RepID=A0A9Q1KJ23_9CARY|nr:hypothetical protein Cgig2_029691 [Carnegiea gigantea]
MRVSTANSSLISSSLVKRKWNPLPIPHGTIPEPKGQDLDFVNVAYSHLMHSDWGKLEGLSSGLTPFRFKHVLLKIKKDYVLSYEFYKWAQLTQPTLHTLETHSMIVHILTRHRKFKSAESILKNILSSASIDLPSKLFEVILYSYRLCDSSPNVFDSLFKIHAHMRKVRNATNTFYQMKDYGFLPTVESCNVFLSSLLSLSRADIVLAFYKKMQRCRILPNIYTLNMVISAYCKFGNLEKALGIFEDMGSMGVLPTVVSYNTLIAGYCSKGLLTSALRLKASMEKSGFQPNNVTFNTLVDGFCKQGKLNEANKLLSEMKGKDVRPDTVTYNTLINGYSQLGNSDLCEELYEEMLRNGVKVDILTYNAVILGLCKEGKNKKAALMVKKLDKQNFVPNSSTYSALINQDFDGAIQVLWEMLGRCMTPDSAVLCELFNGLCHSGKEDLALKLREEVEAKFHD